MSSLSIFIVYSFLLNLFSVLHLPYSWPCQLLVVQIGNVENMYLDDSGANKYCYVLILKKILI